MSVVSLRDAKAGLSSLVDEAVKGEFVTITRHGKPVAALVPLEAAEIARKAMLRPTRSLVRLLQDFPVVDLELERNRTPGRDIEF